MNIGDTRREQYTPPAQRVTFAPTPAPRAAQYMDDYDDDALDALYEDDDVNKRRLVEIADKTVPRRRLASDGTVTVETSTVTVSGVTCDQVYAIVNTPDSKLMTGEVTSGTDAHGVKCTPAVSITAASKFEACPGVLLMKDSEGVVQNTIWCNGRGLCDDTSGICECYAGYNGADCACPEGQEADTTDPRICRLTSSSIEAGAVVLSGLVTDSASEPLNEVTTLTPSPTPPVFPVPAPGEDVEFARLVLSFTLFNVNMEEIVIGDVKKAVVTALNRMLGYDRRRLSKVSAVNVFMESQTKLDNQKVSFKFSVEMQKDRASWIETQLETNSVGFQNDLVSTLRELAPSTYASVAVEVGAVSTVETPTTQHTDQGSASSSNIGLIVAIVVVLALIAGVGFVMFKRHTLHAEAVGNWKVEKTVDPQAEFVDAANTQENTQDKHTTGLVNKSLSRHESEPVNLSMSRKTSRFAMSNPLSRGQEDAVL